MREGARPRMPLEDKEGGRNPLIWVAIGCVVMFFVAVALFVVLAGERPGAADPDDPPAEIR